MVHAESRDNPTNGKELGVHQALHLHGQLIHRIAAQHFLQRVEWSVAVLGMKNGITPPVDFRHDVHCDRPVAIIIREHESQGAAADADCALSAHKGARIVGSEHEARNRGVGFLAGISEPLERAAALGR